MCGVPRIAEDSQALAGRADDLLVFVERAADDRALLLGFVRVIGQQIVLRPVVRHQLPAALLDRIDDAPALLHDHAVAGARRRDAQSCRTHP